MDVETFNIMSISRCTCCFSVWYSLLFFCFLPLLKMQNHFTVQCLDVGFDLQFTVGRITVFEEPHKPISLVYICFYLYTINSQLFLFIKKCQSGDCAVVIFCQGLNFVLLLHLVCRLLKDLGIILFI